MGQIDSALWYVDGDDHVIRVNSQWQGDLGGELLVLGT
jgi:hypothetical protein